jgi:hypothetical protein
MIAINFLKSDVYDFLKDDLPRILNVSKGNHNFYAKRIEKLHNLAADYILDIKTDEGRPVVGILASNYFKGKRNFQKYNQ